MTKQTHLTKMIRFLPFILISFFFLTSAQPVAQEDDDQVTVRLSVWITDIDPPLATVKIRVIVYDVSNNYSRIWADIIGGGYVEVICHNVDPRHPYRWWYQGETNATTWFLEGESESFPFDSYRLNFKLYSIVPLWTQYNFSLSPEYTSAVITGPNRPFLIDRWEERPSIPKEIKNDEASFFIRRTYNAIIIALLQFVVPVILCYYLLGATVFIDSLDDLRSRLTINLSLFVFSSTFMISIREFLPYRSSLSFPESLLTILIISNAIFGTFSIIGKYCAKGKRSEEEKRKETNKWDVYASVFSLIGFFIVFSATLFGKINVITSLVLFYFVVPSFFYNFYVKREELEWVSKKEIRFYITLFLIPLFYVFTLVLIYRWFYGIWLSLF